jgi:hypothetical protein
MDTDKRQENIQMFTREDDELRHVLQPPVATTCGSQLGPTARMLLLVWRGGPCYSGPVYVCFLHSRGRIHALAGSFYRRIKTICISNAKNCVCIFSYILILDLFFNYSFFKKFT